MFVCLFVCVLAISPQLSWSSTDSEPDTRIAYLVLLSSFFVGLLVLVGGFAMTELKSREFLFVCLRLFAFLGILGDFFGDELMHQIGAAGVLIHFVQHKTSSLIQGGSLFADL